MWDYQYLVKYSHIQSKYEECSMETTSPAYDYYHIMDMNNVMNSWEKHFIINMHGWDMLVCNVSLSPYFKEPSHALKWKRNFEDCKG